MPHKKRDDDASPQPEKPDVKLRISTIIKQSNIRQLEASAVMAHHNLKPTDRIEPDRFIQMVDKWLRAPAGGK